MRIRITSRDSIRAGAPDSVSALCFVVECYDKNAPLAFRVEHAED